MERRIHANPRDARALILLGRVWLAWPVFGRWKADSLFTRAGELDPDNPEPFYYLGLVGVALRGDDGELVSRRGLTRVLAIDPFYRDAWTRWLALYRNTGYRRAGASALARHAGQPAADLWRSQLLIELGEYVEAESTLARLVARAPEDPAPRALLAQSRYETGRDTEASLLYEAALAGAALDTGGVLWRQVRSAASPGERQKYSRTPPQGRTAFFRVFWSHRRPSLRAAANGRIGEHFRRLRDARNAYALQYPNSTHFHSSVYRRFPLFNVGISPCLRGALGLDRLGRVALPPTPTAAPTNPDETLNLEDGLDDRGRIFVRYGVPDERIACSVGDETWRYHLPAGVLQVTFSRRTGSESSGDALVTPVAAGEWQAARWLLATDRPTGPTTLPFAYWSATFRGADRRQTELLLIVDSVSAVAALTDALGRDVVLDSATAGPLRLSAPPGRYLLALDVARSDSLGRVRGAITLPPFTGESLAVSGLLLADRDTLPTRSAIAAAARADLRFPGDRPLRVYAEIYGLAAERGVFRYDVEYTVEPIGLSAPSAAGGPRPTSFRFRREQPARSITIESLVVDPGRLPPGRYRLRLVATDALSGAHAASTPVDFELR